MQVIIDADKLSELKANLEEAGIEIEVLISANELKPGFRSGVNYMHDSSTRLMLTMPDGRLAQIKITLGNIEVFSLTPAPDNKDFLDRKRLGQADSNKVGQVHQLLDRLPTLKAHRKAS